jgi:hypothetical protein
MKKYFIVLCAVFLASGCSSVVTKNFKVFTDPPDSSIRVVSGQEMREQKYRSPASITVEVPEDPARAAKSILEVRKENYKPRIIAIRDIGDGDTLNIKLEKASGDTARYRLTYRMTSPVVSEDLTFKDKTIAVSFTVGDYSFKMRFENRSPFDVKILWDRAEYTDVSGQLHRLMHSGVRYQDRNNPIAAQTILSHSVVEQTVTPISNVFISQQKKGYDVRPLFPLESDIAARLKGRSILLFVPVEVDRQIVPYNFKIEITNAVKEPVKG